MTVYHLYNKKALYSATGNGKAPFVSADDIAAVAYHALTDEKSHNTDYLVLGPELLSYDEVQFKQGRFFLFSTQRAINTDGLRYVVGSKIQQLSGTRYRACEAHGGTEISEFEVLWHPP